LREIQSHLSERFGALRDSRTGSVFFIEHGLTDQEFTEVLASVRTSLRVHPLESSWWDARDLPLLIVATEVGYRYRGTGTDFWPLLDEELGVEIPGPGRQWIRDLFARASEQFRGVRPPETPWAEAFHLIAWPIAHALLPREFLGPFTATLANLRISEADSADDALYKALRAAAPNPTSRFAMFLEEAEVITSLARSILRRDAHGLSAEIVDRLAKDIETDRAARRGVAVARRIQRAAADQQGGATPLPQAMQTNGKLQLRLVNGSLILEGSFPRLAPDTSEGLRHSLRRRRFAPRLWGLAARVSSDQLLSGLPFPIRLNALPDEGAPIFPDLDSAELDGQELTILSGFQLNLSPPHIFAVASDGDLARQIIGSSVSGYRRYWALLHSDESGPSGARKVGEVGPFRCYELDPSDAGNARALQDYGLEIKFGISVRFAGSPPLEPGAATPTYLEGDTRVLVPQRLLQGVPLSVELDGQAATTVDGDEVVRMRVAAGEHRIRVSGDTGARDYTFRGIAKLPRRLAPVRINIRSEELTIQALLGGRFSLVIDGDAPLDGLDLTLTLGAGGNSFSATGPLGPIPTSVSGEHTVMKALLSDEVRDLLSIAETVTLRAHVGHIARASWELERPVRPCWWQSGSNPQLLSEAGPLRYGVIQADKPLDAPADGAPGSGTYLLAPVELNHLEFSPAAEFSTLCNAPSRAQLHDLSIAVATRPTLERRRRGRQPGVGLEDLTEAYLRWSLAETQNAIAVLHRGQVTAKIEQWMVELCCGQEWELAERKLPRRSAWGVLEEVCSELSLGRDGYVEFSEDQAAQFYAIVADEIRHSLPGLWAGIGLADELDESDYVTLDHATAAAYEKLAALYRNRGRVDLAESLEDADPGDSPEHWDAAVSMVEARTEFSALAAMLIPTSSAAKLMALDLGEMSADDVADELTKWAKTVERALAGSAPPRELLKAAYALWVAPEVAASLNWRDALDMLLAERGVARAIRYLSLRQRQAGWGRV
jgi:hypothetical protein